MRFRRSRQPPPAAQFELSDVPLDELTGEIKRRGLDVLPAGGIRELESRAEQAEVREGCLKIELERLTAKRAELEDRAGRLDRLHELTPEELEQFHLLGEIASKDFPETVAELGDAWRENRELSAVASRAEQETAMLATVMVEDAVARFGRGEGLADD
jgi:hypothetical protein